ncbi:hypothetical protein [Ruegeria sp. ANG-R]|uniref:hypothetical protein n=1 Tax=Ruegeria sp. ANG-R TaxID=1577903 RepID=UPI00068D63DD|nr:hypothetical protein [Ruegeria sp. ANG-R]
MITLAFYKGRSADFWSRATDAVIRAATRGRYSHVEFIPGPVELGSEYVCLSSSGRDGGVREKMIHLSPEHWDLVELAIPSADPEAYIRERIGAPYDYPGLILSHFFAFGGHDKARWFCSELCAAALGLPDPHRVSPQMLFDIVTWPLRAAPVSS